MAVRFIVSCLVVGLLLGVPALTTAQQVNVQTPFNGVGHSLYEQIGVNWGVRGNGWFFNFGGPPPVPPFGGYDPGAQANFGFGGPNGFLNITAGQGSDRSIVSSSPSVTVMNGGTGYFSDTIQRPFVTGLIPVVGSAPGLPGTGVPGPILGPSVLQERLSRLQAEGAAAAAPSAPSAPASVAPPAASSAERGELSVAEIKARRSAEKSAAAGAAQAEIDALLEQARGAEAEGKPNVARIYLQQAARRAPDDRRSEIQAWILRLGK
jgi:hypothetical protein